MNLQARKFIVIGVLFITFGVIGLFIKDDLIEYLNLIPIFPLTFSIILLLSGIGFILNIYLQGGFSREDIKTAEESRMYYRELQNLRNEFTHKLNEESRIQIDLSEIQDIIERKIERITNDSLLEQIKEKFEDKLIDHIRFKSLGDELLYLKDRIDLETSRISRNANTNLTIGFITTFMAIFFLGYSLLGFSHTTETTQNFMYHFIPRLSLSIFIELFSFFFLRIYRKNLDDIKYLNNERTNIDLKLIALKTSILHNDSKSLELVISELAKTERNFILKKDESTVELEKGKIEREQMSKTLDSIVQLLKQK